jgi:hypothetical protein
MKILKKFRHTKKLKYLASNEKVKASGHFACQYIFYIFFMRIFHRNPVGFSNLISAHYIVTSYLYMMVMIHSTFRFHTLTSWMIQELEYNLRCKRIPLPCHGRTRYLSILHLYLLTDRNTFLQTNYN